MVTISLCMIVKDEEDTIARCLDSVHHLVDDIVIVDTGSTDATKRICRRYTDRLFDFKWTDNFSEARNYAFSHATQDFIFWLDADDVLSEADQRKFLQLKQTLTRDTSAVSMLYHLTFDAQGAPRHSLRRYRLVNRDHRFQWIGAVHEYLQVSGHVLHSEVAVQHRKVKTHSDRNLNIYAKMLAEGRPFSPRDLYYYANELKDHHMYEEALTYYEKFFATGKGWMEDLVGAANRMSECYKNLKDEERALKSALRTLQYDHPRPEACCRIGEVYYNRRDYYTAIFWFRTALANLKPEGDSVRMFDNADYATWVPHLYLCVCYNHVGSYFLAYLHNEYAAKYMPDDERIIRNRQILKSHAEAEKRTLQRKYERRFLPADASDSKEVAVRESKSVADGSGRGRKR